MYNLTKKQLEKCQLADLSNFDKDTSTFHIKKYSKAVFESNKSYIIKIPTYLINNKDSVLAVNWNNSTFPPAETMMAYVEKVNGKMIFVHGKTCNTANEQPQFWSGWLDMTELQIVSKL